MKLFFETTSQSASFLMMVPIGFAVLLLLEADILFGVFRPAADILLIILCGFTALWITSFTGEAGLRLYHALGLLVGGFIYLHGVGKVISRFRYKKNRPKAGDGDASGE